MRLAGYALERGILPEHILSLPREERLIYTAMMELNREEEMQRLEAALHNALVLFWNAINEKK
jgi:hypothetical protein